jgi:hypothetical protein
MLRRQLAALGLAAAALTAIGCGSSSKGKSLASVELIAKADVICARVHAQYHANGYTTAQSIAHLAPRVASYEQIGVSELRKLIPPASMAGDWKQIVDGAQTVAEETAKLGQYAKDNNLKAATPLLSSSLRRQQQVLAVAARDGFKECSRAS